MQLMNTTRLNCLRTLALTTVLGALTAQAQIVLQDGFEANSHGEFPPNWQLVFNGSGNAAQYVDATQMASGSKSLRLQGSSCWAAAAYRSADLPRKVKFSCRMKMDQVVAAGCTSSQSIIGFYNPTVGVWGTIYGYATVASDGLFHPQGEGSWPALMEDWNRVEVFADLDARTSYVRINSGPLGGPYAFQGDGEPTGIHLTAGHGNLPTAWFDDVVVETWLTTPTILTNPLPQIVAVGATASFSVFATGQGPLNYQWRHSGTNLPGATNATLTLGDVQAHQVGEYSVIVSNNWGAVTSSNALLSLDAIDTCAVITLIGLVGTSYQVDWTDALDSNHWQVLTNVTLPRSPFVLVDFESTHARKRFYRIRHP